MSTEENDYATQPAVINLQNYLRIKCVHPDINYDETINFLKSQASAMGLQAQTHVLSGNNPVLVVTWEGLQPELPAILLNSHMDVVPAVEENWKHPPFDAEIEDGVIYGRGAQDMRSASIQHLEAIRALKTQGFRLKRTVHLTFVPEEEKGGEQGMGEFVKTEAFRQLNVGFALDEGLSHHGEEFLVFNGEKTMWHVKIICTGKSGHGSMFLPDNSGEKIRHIINRFMELRDKYQQMLVDDSSLTIGDVTTINLTKLQGGILTNIVPEKFTATFDIRLATNVNHELFEAMINRWCKEAGTGVTCEFQHKDRYIPPTKMDDSNPFWTAMKEAIEGMNIALLRRTMPCTTDVRFLRARCPALNFSPMRRVPPLPHQRDERLPLSVFLQGVRIRHIINRFMELRDKYQQMLVDDSSLTIGDVTTINLTKLQGGILTNIVPEKFTATFDIRLATNVNHELFEAMINRWCKEAGTGVTCEFQHKDRYIPPTKMDDSNPFWTAMKEAIEGMNIALLRRTMPCTTDVRFLRARCPALNFSPMRRVPPLPHQRHERLPLSVFLQGVRVYENVLRAVANV